MPPLPILTCESCSELRTAVHIPKAATKTSRIGISSFFKYARAVATMILIVTYLGQRLDQGWTQLTNILLILTNKSALTSFFMVVHVLLVRLVLRLNLPQRLRWATDLKDATHSSMIKASSTEALCKIGSSISKSSMQFLGCLGQNETRSMSISAKDPFHPTEEIACMTLVDISDIFRFAVECNRVDFHKSTFLSNLRPAAKLAISSIDRAVEASRGATATLSKCAESGDIDALTFAAAVRIFAEWRSLRLVPRGYRRFAYSMSLAKRDLILNVKKIETAAHSWMQFYEAFNSMSAAEPSEGARISSPTLRQLVQHEIDQKMHSRPSLSDKSGASGFLWTKRQLQYQTAIFENMAEVPVVFADGKSAVTAAYKLVYENYHGFLAKQIFQSSFEAAPDAITILRCLSPTSAEQGTSNAEPTCSTYTSDSSGHIERECALSLPPDLRVAAPQTPIEHVASQLTKLPRFFSQCACFDGEAQASINAVASVKSLTCSDIHISGRRGGSGQTDISHYLLFMQPFLQELDNIVNQLNINDPTKV